MLSQASSIAQRIHDLRQQLPSHVKLVAVTKTFPAEIVRAAYDAGVRDFGESRVQEAIAKQAQLHDLNDVTWHLIGHLQSNKAQKALHHFQWIQSVDSLKLALRLNQLAADLPHPPKVCLQVKLRPDPNKYGWSADELIADLPRLDQCDRLNIVGLMAIPPLGLSADETRAYFEEVRDLAATLRQHPWQRIQMTELSMGMSEDYSLAVDAGATIIRPGRILFGDRQ